jgi:hypothetical protein
MKNKTPKPRVMWAWPSHLADRAGPIWASREKMISSTQKPVRVAIIPLFDVEAIVERACNAHWREAGGAAMGRFDYRDGIRAALTAAGIPCLKRKAHK